VSHIHFIGVMKCHHVQYTCIAVVDSVLLVTGVVDSVLLVTGVVDSVLLVTGVVDSVIIVCFLV